MHRKIQVRFIKDRTLHSPFCDAFELPQYETSLHFNKHPMLDATLN